jgi:hypothetical protein
MDGYRTMLSGAHGVVLLNPLGLLLAKKGDS